MTIEKELSLTALRSLLTELIDGPSDRGSWVLGRGDKGLIGVLQQITAETASRAPAEDRRTIAAHAAHVKYALELLNRWAGGEENPFASADWQASWRRQCVTDAQWQQLVDELRGEADAWIAACEAPRQWDEISLTGSLASAAHLAYHLGAIRQLVIFLTEKRTR